MDLDLGSLEPKIIEYAGYDIDKTLWDADDEYPSKFSRYTAICAQKISQEAKDRDLKDLTNLAKNSYENHGDTTVTFQRAFGLNARKLYIDHHDCINDELLPQFHDSYLRPDATLGLSINALRKQNIVTHAFTNGTENYGKYIAYHRGLAGCFSSVSGVDSFNNSHLTFKNSRKTVVDWVTHAGIVSRNGYLYTPNSGMREVADWDYKNLVFFDDTPLVLEVLKGEFNAQTVLIESDRVKPTASQNQAFDTTVPRSNLWRLNFAIADAVRQSNKVSSVFKF